MRIAALLLIATILAAGCTSTNDADDADSNDMMALASGSYQMQLSGMPTAPLSPGQMFNVTVQAMAGMGGMHSMMSDHIGAHYWNMTLADPTGALGNATTCAHRTADAPGTYTAQCQAPMQAGTYHLRSHMRMMDDEQMMHHWWSDEQTFTVA
ncbi:MAG: hypothetical protein WC876_05665 [Candidatus Thermoplasmatota archaeon]|jgi:hypothetical protein